MIDALSYSFFRNALLVGFLASVACGIIGTYVVTRRMVFISGGISHSAFGGIGIAYYLGQNPILGAILFSLGSALGIGYITKEAEQREDTTIGAVWAIGMALGVIFIYLAPGYVGDLMSYLFGSILLVSEFELLVIALLDIVILGTVLLFYRQFLSICFDEEYAEITGVNVRGIYLLLLCLVALTVVVLIRAVGIILVIALLTLPAATSGLFTKSLKRMMLLATGFGMLFTFSGIWVSYLFDIPSGATIILVSGVVYIVSIVAKKYLRRRN